jgi:hypothetical protein
MRAIGAMLAAMGIMDAADFLARYTTTLGHRIYPCFTVGDPATMPFPDQAAVCVHEHVHVRQFEVASFAGEYCACGGLRTQFECEAYRATMEIAFWFSGKCPATTTILRALKGYALGADDLAFARVYLDKAAAVIRRGGVVTPEAKVAIAWLKRNT